VEGRTHLSQDDVAESHRGRACGGAERSGASPWDRWEMQRETRVQDDKVETPEGADE
jgi:hypothetical protein